MKSLSDLFTILVVLLSILVAFYVHPGLGVIGICGVFIIIALSIFKNKIANGNKTAKDTELEFYREALLYQSFFVNRISAIKTYGNRWNDDYCLDYIRKCINDYYSDKHIKEIFSINNLTIERAKSLHFFEWDKDGLNLYLFPTWFVFFLPYGTKVVDINGNRFEYTKQTDVTPRGGHVPFGIELK